MVRFTPPELIQATRDHYDEITTTMALLHCYVASVRTSAANGHAPSARLLPAVTETVERIGITANSLTGRTTDQFKADVVMKAELLFGSFEATQ